MEGFDDDWIHTHSDRRYVTYTNLDPGSYTFRVKASNNDGIWNEESTAISIIITPPWWETAWFKMSAFSLIVVIVIGGYRRRVRRIEMKKRELEIQVDERTRSLSERTEQLALSNTELTKAKEQAEAANRAKSTFLSNMSHEIRTPLNGILGFAQLLQAKEKEPKKKKYLERIHASGRVLLKIINDILDLSRMESGTMELRCSKVSMTSIFSELDSLFLDEIRNKGIGFEMVLDPELPDALVMDETRLMQAFINLIGNAIKFTDSGSIKISCDVENTENAPRSRVDLTLKISDTGVGISQEHIDSIFESFNRETWQKDKQYDGTGLGLTITKQIIEMMGGTVTLESELGKGSTFTLFIPNVEIAAVETDSKQAERINALTISFAPATILLADDIDYNLELFTDFLSDWNFTFHYARNGKEVLDKTNEIHPDMIFLDIRMPVMDGIEAAKRLKANSRTKDLPIIAVTASALKQDEETIVQFCDGYLRKPISKNDVIQELVRHLPHERIKKVEPVPASTTIPEIFPPSKEELEKLCSFATTGNINEIEVLIEKLKNADRKYVPFAERLEAMANEFQLESIIKFVSKYMDS